MQKDELIERLYNSLSSNIDTDAMQANVMFQVQVMAAMAPEEIALDLTPLFEKIPQVIDMEDFLEYWIKAIEPHLSEEELTVLVDYFESEQYQKVNAMMKKIEPLIQNAMISYATAIGDKLLEDIIPQDPAVQMN